MSAPVRLAVLISGGGRTALNLLDAIERGELDAAVVLAIASRHDAAGIQRLRDRGVPVEIVARSDFPEGSALHDRTDELLLGAGERRSGGIGDDARAGVDLICLCGWLRHFRLCGPKADWRGRVLNIHPSLLPRHGGTGMHGDRVHAAVLAAGDALSGCTVHEVDEIYDHGPTLLQKTVPVLAGDDVQTLAARVFAAECAAYPEAVRLWIARRRRERRGTETRSTPRIGT
ncbi:MAG TPA: phosphoribosylglycinamide formyltransferase [Phycisphaerales bacterium]|nr:phosphoribosylglycinamide formyltransferase [Phycisphaerales bacterium]HMP38200.1 phosphoribosylglycinamide formyltransferase [Phycisphaerales bacterium]